MKVLKVSLALAVVLAAGGWLALPARAQESPATQPAQALAPAFELKDHTGKTVRLADYQGKIVVLEWFNPDCQFVQRHYSPDHRTMLKLANQYTSQGVVWLAVNTTHTANAQINAKAAEAWSIPYPILDDSSGEVGRAYGAKTTPHMFVIDRQGAIAYQGAIDDDPWGKNPTHALNYVDQALQSLLAGQPVATPKTKSYGCSVKYR